MKQFKIITALVILGFGIITVAGCYKDVINPGSDPNGPPQEVSFSGDIIPILNKNCNSSGCHDAVPTKQPSLAPSTAYNAIVSGGYINLITPQNSKLYTSIKSGSMPPSGTVPSADQQKILDWIRLGAPNN